MSKTFTEVSRDAAELSVSEQLKLSRILLELSERSPEPLEAVHARALAAMKEIVARHPEGEGMIAVVSHQVVLALLKCYVLDKPWSQIRKHALGVASYEVLTVGEGFTPRA